MSIDLKSIAASLAMAGALVCGTASAAEASSAGPVPAMHTAASTEGVAAGGPTDQQLSDLMTFAVEDAAAYWNRVLNPIGVRSGTRYRWYRAGSGAQLGCGVSSARPNAFYCPPDDTIYIAYQFARERYLLFGDMATVSVVAHEYGHNVQSELGLTRRPADATLELHADCLSGAYASDANGRGLLDAGDVAEARLLARASGDAGPSADPHGSGEQREAAWLLGFGRGVHGCFT